MERSVQRLGQALGRDSSGTERALDPEPYQERFLEAMDDDLNTPRALASLFDPGPGNQPGRDDGRNIGQAQGLPQAPGEVLGLTLQGQRAGQEERPAAGRALVRLLLTSGPSCGRPSSTNWRTHPAGTGRSRVSLEDSPDGTHWQFRRRP